MPFVFSVLGLGLKWWNREIIYRKHIYDNGLRGEYRASPIGTRMYIHATMA